MRSITEPEALLLAKKTAGEIVSQALSEYDGAKIIWKDIIDPMGPKCPDALWPFKSNASAIEDIRWNAEKGGAKNDDLIRQCEEEILQAAKALVSE